MSNIFKKINVINTSWFVFAVGLVTCLIASLLGLLFLPLAIIWVLPFFFIASVCILIMGIVQKKQERKKILFNLIIQSLLYVLIIIYGLYLTATMADTFFF